MFISVVLNTEYWDYASRTKWYLKNLLHCKENGWIMVTHDYLNKHFEEFQKDVTDRFFNEFEMRRFTLEEVNSVEQYFIPDFIFDNKEKECGSRTQALIDWTDKSFPEIESYFDIFIGQIKEKHPNEKIDGIFHCLESFQFMRNISEKYDIPLISYSFSAIRKPHGYRQTLYHTNCDGYLYTGDECRKRYNIFCNEKEDDIPVFANQELISIIGKERTLPLIPLIDQEPQYELGICGESFAILPQFFNRNVYTDDDIFYETSKIYTKEQISMRSHAAQLDMIRVDRNGVHNDPAPFLLSCKRLTAVRSQIMLKSLLWKRTAIVMKNTLGFDFLCSKDYISAQAPDINKLNYYIFGYLIPSGLMYSDEYWKWRFYEKPSEHAIYRRHLEFIFEQLGLDRNLLVLEQSKRMTKLLESRGCDEWLISDIVHNKCFRKVNYDAAICKFVVNNKAYWRLNYDENGSMVSDIELDMIDSDSVDFFPFDDVAGGCELLSVTKNGASIDLSQIKGYCEGFRYIAKTKGHYTIPLNPSDKNINLRITWNYKSLSQFVKDL